MKKMLLFTLLLYPCYLQAQKLSLGISGGLFKNSGNFETVNYHDRYSVFNRAGSIHAALDLGRWQPGLRVSVTKLQTREPSNWIFMYTDRIADPALFFTAFVNRKYALKKVVLLAGVQAGYVSGWYRYRTGQSMDMPFGTEKVTHNYGFCAGVQGEAQFPFSDRLSAGAILSTSVVHMAPPKGLSYTHTILGSSLMAAVQYHFK